MTTFQAFPSALRLRDRIKRHSEHLIRQLRARLRRADTTRLARTTAIAWERIGVLPRLVVVTVASGTALGLVAVASTATLAAIYLPRWQAFAAQLGFDL